MKMRHLSFTDILQAFFKRMIGKSNILPLVRRKVFKWQFIVHFFTIKFDRFSLFFGKYYSKCNYFTLYFLSGSLYFLILNILDLRIQMWKTWKKRKCTCLWFSLSAYLCTSSLTVTFRSCRMCVLKKLSSCRAKPSAPQ